MFLWFVHNPCTLWFACMPEKGEPFFLRLHAAGVYIHPDNPNQRYCDQLRKNGNSHLLRFHSTIPLSKIDFVLPRLPSFLRLSPRVHLFPKRHTWPVWWGRCMHMRQYWRDVKRQHHVHTKYLTKQDFLSFILDRRDQLDFTLAREESHIVMDISLLLLSDYSR